MLAHAADVISPTLAVAALTIAAAAAALIPERALRQQLLRGVVLATFAFQGFHLVEHVLQLGHWVVHPDRAPWITPWAVPARDLLAAASDGLTATGTELLHLAGNAVFLVGLVALRWVDGASAGAGRRPLAQALVVQGLHVAEHVVLTLTLLARGRADGLSTLLGVLSPGTPLAATVRVWFHFAVNLAATLTALAALRAVRRPGRRLEPVASERDPARVPG